MLPFESVQVGHHVALTRQTSNSLHRHKDHNTPVCNGVRRLTSRQACIAPADFIASVQKFSYSHRSKLPFSNPLPSQLPAACRSVWTSLSPSRAALQYLAYLIQAAIKRREDLIDSKHTKLRGRSLEAISSDGQGR